MYFDIDLSPLILLLAGISVIATLYLATVYRARIMKVARLRKRSIPDRDERHDSMPDISIIVYTKENAGNLPTMLTGLLAQDYPAGFEIIVANDGRSETASDTVTRMSVTHRNLKLTYVPDEAHALSRKKLAITLGIKAARNDYVLLTSADTIVPSDRWLSLIGRHFANGKEVVIGHAHPVDRKNGNGKPMTAYDILHDAVTYLSAAATGHPYRGSAVNLAFRRQLFFDNKGFAESVGYHHGEDDIFVSKIATPSNCAVELAPQAQVAIKCHDLKSRHHDYKLQHRFTGHYVSKRSRRFFSTGPIMSWLWAASAIAAGIISFPNILPATAAVVTAAGWMITIGIAWKSAATALGIKISGWITPLMMMFHPAYNLLYRLKAKSFSDRNYTWSKP